MVEPSSCGTLTSQSYLLPCEVKKPATQYGVASSFYKVKVKVDIKVKVKDRQPTSEQFYYLEKFDFFHAFQKMDLLSI